MNYGMMTVSEVLRVAEPATELEIKLFDIISRDDLEAGRLRQSIDELSAEMDDMYGADDYRELESSLEDRDEEIELLKSLLDDNDIDYSDLGLV